MARKRKITKDTLIERVMQGIKLDINAGDTTAIHELLKSCPTEHLLTFLPDKDLIKTLDIALDPKPKAVTAVQVFLLTEPMGKTRAFARVQLHDDLQLTGLRIMDGIHGMFVAYPVDASYYTGEDFKSIYYPLTAILRDEIEDAVIAKYKDMVK